MCVTHAKHSFPSRCEKHNTIGMDASRCERFNQSSSSSLCENTDSFLSESVSVVLWESKETLESARRLQNEGLPLWSPASMGLRVSPGNYSFLLICANHTTASNHGNCWDTHAWQGRDRTHTHIKKATSHKKRSGWMDADSNYAWTALGPPAHQNNWCNPVNEKAGCPDVVSCGGFPTHCAASRSTD